ncbi:MAG: dihydrodipicolinate synthase family protein [Aristaeellaceae bacterium]
MKRVSPGVYPTMITPYTVDRQLDLDAVDRLVEFYVARGCQGIFAVCLSSEMFTLSEDERVALAARVVKAARGRLCVVASGHVSEGMEDQLRELRRMADTGVDNVVLVANRLARPDDPDEVLLGNLEHILAALPEVTFGMYECPAPYRRPLTDKVLTFLAESGRFSFIKDTCCDAEVLAHRAALLSGRAQLFNANAATVLSSLRAGGAGFSGIMGNFHPDLYVRLFSIWQEQPEKAEALQAVLSVLSGEERSYYPVSCKYHMNLLGVPMELTSRTRDAAGMQKTDRLEMEDLLRVEQLVREQFCP